MSTTNKTISKEWHEFCNCKCRLDPSLFNNKQRWNKDKCWYKSKELIDKVVCDKRFLWNLVILNATAINHVILENI